MYLYPISVTLDAFHLLTLPMKEEALFNMAYILVTLEMAQDKISSLNPACSLNKLFMSVTSDRRQEFISELHYDCASLEELTALDEAFLDSRFQFLMVGKVCFSSRWLE